MPHLGYRGICHQRAIICKAMATQSWWHPIQRSFEGNQVKRLKLLETLYLVALQTIDILGIDIAKNVFQLHGVNRNGRAILKRRVMRDQLLDVVGQVEPCTGAWQPAPAQSARPRRAGRRANSAAQDRPCQSVGQPASGAAPLQPCNGGGRQQERTDHLGRAANGRTVPRRLLKTRLSDCETTEK